MTSSRVQRIHSGSNRFAFLPAVFGAAVAMLLASPASAQLYTTTATTTNWDAARWSTSQAGPFTSAWVSGSNTVFAPSSTYTFNRLSSVSNGTTTFGNITLGASSTIAFQTQAGQKFVSSGTGTNFTIGAGSLINFGAITTVNPSAGTTAIFKNGAGTLSLAGGAYTGGFTLNDGLVVGLGNNAFGTGAMTVTGGVISSNGNRAFGVSSLAVNGDFQVGSTFAGGGNSSTGNISFASNVTLGGAGVRTITIGGNGVETFSGAISGGSGLKFARTNDVTVGVISLTGANTYGGNTEINGSTIQVSGNNSVLSTGTVTLTGADASQLKINSGLTLANNFVIDSSAGQKLITNYLANAQLTGNIVNNDTVSDNFALAADLGKVFTVSGSITGAGGIQVGTPGLLGTVLLTGTNGYQGNTDIYGGTLQIGSDGAIRNDLSFLQANTGVLDLNGKNASVNAVNGTFGTITSSQGGSQLIIGGNNSDSTLQTSVVDYSGDPNLGITLVKEGTGTLTLAGNTLQFSGLTYVNNGTVKVATAQEFLGGATVMGNGTLTGSGTFDGDITVNNGGSLDVRLDGAAGTFSAANIAIYGSGATTTMQIDSESTYSQLNSQGDMAYGGNLVIRFDNTQYADFSTFSLFSFANAPTNNFATITTAAGSGDYSGLTFAYNADRDVWYTPLIQANGQYLTFTPSTGSLVIVPEPSTWAMTLASVGFAGWMARRKQLAKKKLRVA